MFQYGGRRSRPPAGDRGRKQAPVSKRKTWQWRCALDVRERTATETVIRVLRRHGRLSAAELAIKARMLTPEARRAAVGALLRRRVARLVRVGDETYIELRDE
jgi:thymidylate synthase ThyX